MKVSTPVGEETFDDVQATEEAIPWQDVVLPFLAVVTLIGVGPAGNGDCERLLLRRPLEYARVPVDTSDDTLVEPIDSNHPDAFGDPTMSANEPAWRLKCDGCGKVLSVPVSLAGRQVKCPKCAHAFRVPDAKPTATPSDLDPPTAPIPNRNAGRGTASDPGNVSLSREKLEVLYPNFFTSSGLLMRLWKSLAGSAPFSPSAIDKHLRFGDSRAAVVVSVSPLLVAAYSDERDCVVMLKFSEELVATYHLKPGSRLMTVNTYMQGPKRPVADLIEGPLSRGNWHNVIPMIADFLSDDRGTIESRKQAIRDEEWQRTAMLGAEYMQKKPGKARDGRPLDSWKPCVTSLF
jgi:phage FluMu protein Com